ncbi:hypothetical protein KJ953_03390 [Patescibacteria group bacterium]|nr:hypothetical protein [Patescibacteria group bacterium]MBU1256716.1 hypothetical protein [Patescibacteria group bacterium]MBU1457677.1 hypothetical protein [Patescibacteria group bacterium]
MSSFFGVDFFRIVNEGLVDDWAQVYAKVPFEEEELISKGSLFGVLRIKGGKKLVSKGSDIFLWLDEYFNKTEEKGDLRGLVEGLLKVSSELEAAWVWVMIDSRTGDRVAKSVAMNGGKVIIVRDGRQMVLSNGDERVVTGGLKAGDRLGLGVGGMVGRLQGLGDKGLEKAVADLNEQVEKETEQAVAGLLLEVRPVSVKASATPGEPMLVTPGETSDEEPLVAERIVTDRMVGGKKWMRWLRRPKGRLNIGSGTEKNGKVLWLGVVFLILLVVSVVGGVIRGKKEKIETSWQSEVGSWQKREDEAKSLVQVNPMGARKLLREVQTEVENAENVWVGTKYEEEWVEYKQKLDKSWVEVSGEKQVEPTLFLGLSLIRSELKGSRIVGLGEGVGVLDLELGLMVKVNLEDKKAEVLASDKEKKWKAVGGDGAKVVFLTGSGLGLSGKEEAGFDATVVDPVEIEVFGGGIYVLDAGAGEVWKFNLVGSEIQDRRRWLNPEQEIGMGELVDLSIDGDIWVLGKKGEVSKLRRGSRERFALEGKPENLVGDRLAVQFDGEKLAILDNAGSRIVVFNKESGEYLHQLMWDGFSKAKDILYTEDGRLLVLSEGKLLWVE